MLSPRRRPTRHRSLLALLAVTAGGALGGCILLSRFDDVASGSAPLEAGTDAPEASAPDAGDVDADAEASGPGCACVVETIASQPGVIPTSLAVDDLQGTVYWTTDRLIERCPTSGCGTPLALVDAQAPHRLTVGLSHLAWVSNDSAIWILPKTQLDGGAPIRTANTVEVSVKAIAIDDKQPQAAIVFLDTSWLFSCPAVQVPTGTSNDCDGQMIAYGLNAGRGLVLDRAAYYFIARASNGDHVYRCGVAGCGDAPQVLAATVGSPQDLAQDNDRLYWIEATGFDGGAILSAPKIADSGGPDVLIGGLTQPEAIAADERAVYFTDLRESAIKRVEKDGGAVVVIASAQAAPRLVTLDTSYVYWANQGDGTIRRAPKCARCP